MQTFLSVSLISLLMECQQFNQCGGCSALHIPYSTQLENKKRLLENITKTEVKVFSANEFNYRNRMDFIFTSNSLGLRKKSEWQHIIPLDSCAIADLKINILVKEINSFFKGIDAFDVRKHSGTFRYAVIRSANDSSISFVLNSKSSKLAEAIEKIKSFANISTAENILVTYVPPETDSSTSSDYFVVKGKDFLTINYSNKQFNYSIQSFFQNNHSMAQKMQDYCTELLKKHSPNETNLLDLYGGVGTFGIINSELFQKVTIVEFSKESIEMANKNIKLNSLTNIEAFAMDAKYLYKLNLKQPLFIITDPPRTGMDQKTIQSLKELQPKLIIYISCNIEQLGKDLEKFTGYKIKNAAMFDMFPQTNHIEAIVEMVKK